jgi:hypothetical protein
MASIIFYHASVFCSLPRLRSGAVSFYPHAFFDMVGVVSNFSLRYFLFSSTSHVHAKYDLLVWFEILELAPSGE